jgi:hypothetical protein
LNPYKLENYYFQNAFNDFKNDNFFIKTFLLGIHIVVAPSLLDDLASFP